jgi:hypothetical protein
MIDHELNIKMAELCGFVVYPEEDRLPTPGHIMYVYVANGCLYLEEQGDSVWWNPVDDWNQVFRYVLPAMAKYGLDISIDYPRNPNGFHDVIVCPDPTGPGNSTAASFEDQENPLPRVVCETIFNAIEKL